MKRILSIIFVLLLSCSLAYAHPWFGDGGGISDLTAPGPIGSVTPSTGVFTGVTVGSSTAGGNQTINATLTSIHTFTNANWNEDGATWTFATTTLNHVAGNTTAVTATLTEAVVAGTTYKVTITGTGGGGTATYTLGGVTGTTIAASGAIAIEDYITAATTGVMIITPASACTVSITSITVEKLTNATGDLTVDGNLTVRSPSTFNSPITVPTGLVATPSIVADDADSGFYFGSKGFGWSVDATNKYSFDSSSNAVFGATTTGSLATTIIHSHGSNLTLLLQDRNSTTADNMVEMATGTTTFTGFDGEIVGVNIMPTVGVLDDGDTMTLLKLSPTGTPASTLGIMRGLAFGNWGGTGTDSAYMIDTTATGYDAVVKGSISTYDSDAAAVTPARTTKTFNHTAALAADANDACGGTADCLTLPIPTTMGYLEMWTDGSLYLSAVCVTAGTCTVITDSDAAGVGVEYQAAIASCTGLCLHDGGTNSIIFNDTAGAVTVTVRFVYD